MCVYSIYEYKYFCLLIKDFYTHARAHTHTHTLIVHARELTHKHTLIVRAQALTCTHKPIYIYMYGVGESGLSCWWMRGPVCTHAQIYACVCTLTHICV